MKKPNEKYILEARKLWKTVVHSDKFAGQEMLQQHIERYKPLLNIFQAGTYYYLIYFRQVLTITCFSIL